MRSFNDFYSSPNIIQVIMCVKCAMCGEKKNVHRFLVGKKPDVKRELGRPSHRRQDGRV
jgi:hypothetical protein